MADLRDLARSAKGKQLLNSKKLEITVVSAWDETVLLRGVSKRMLAHFCGWNFLEPLLLYASNGKQQLRLDNKDCELYGLKIVVDWMQRACKNPKIGAIEAPSHDVVAACSIQRALRALCCCTDAHRVNAYIKSHYFDNCNLNAQKVTQMYRTFSHPCEHLYWTADNVFKSLEMPNKHLPSSFKRNLRAAIRKNPSLEINLSTIKHSIDARGPKYEADEQEREESVAGTHLTHPWGCPW